MWNMSRAKQFVQNLLKEADVQINGNRLWDIQIHDERTFDRVLAQSSLGFGEAYMDGWWNATSIDQLLTHIFNANLETRVKSWQVMMHVLFAYLQNQQSTSRAFQVGQKHYDIGNDLYRAMLGTRMVYTCGYWKNASGLEEAQDAKLDLVCQKVGLKKGMRVLDIGCGWGSFAKFAAEKYGVEVVGITVSKEQAELAADVCKDLPVEIRLQDYREINESFDAVVSLGMFEHVGEKNYRTYMEIVHRTLPEHGTFLLHTIGGNRSVGSTDPWIEKYIFPNSMLPSAAQIARATEGLFVMEDWHNFGTDYDKTLMAWHANFTQAWPTLQKTYGDRFGRMWNFYLLTCAASFRTRKNQLFQIVLSKNGLVDGHQSIR